MAALLFAATTLILAFIGKRLVVIDIVIIYYVLVIITTHAGRTTEAVIIVLLAPFAVLLFIFADIPRVPVDKAEMAMRAGAAAVLGYLAINAAVQRDFARQALRKANADLELRVAKRTAELEQRDAKLRREIIERTEAEALLVEQTRTLETLAHGAPLEDVLTTIVKTIEERAKGMLCSILLANKEEGLLRPGVAPSLPDSYNQGLAQGVPIGPNAGSCGTAAFRTEPVISSDIASDPIWADYRALALGNGLRACWSTPIFSSKRQILGTFAMYYHEPRSPGDRELRLIEVATYLASVAIECKQTQQSLQSAREELEGKVERQMLRKNPYGLTFRELTILHPLAVGKADKEIAAELVISPLTVQKHVSNILGKMGASSRTEAATRALREGLLE